MISTWVRRAAFCERVERFGLHGLHFWHAAICKRRAWFHLHGINFAEWSETVAAGAARHRASHARDRSVEGLLGLSPDRVDWRAARVYEHKGADAYREAADLQAAFYALMLTLSTGRDWTAVVHVISRRREREVRLSPALLDRLDRLAEELEELASREKAPSARRETPCIRCAYAVLCWGSRET
jgi:CRISPR-associated exonuclease Cas4